MLSLLCVQVYLGHRKPPLQSSLPDNVEQCAAIQHITPNSIVLEDEREVDVDVLLFCTGYKFTFPFLTPECAVKIEGKPNLGLLLVEPVGVCCSGALRYALCAR